MKIKFHIANTLLACLLLTAFKPASAQNHATNTPNVPGFTQPAPLDFNDHEGYVSLFNGKNLEGWDGNPKFWRVEEGAIVGESTRENPSGNSYIAYRGMKAKDF
ncbi:MAG: family 16 glycoside hydrolase, partial [Mucilaginibacter sp.]